MKAVRVLLFAAGAILALGLIAVGVVLNSSFQTWAARRALAAQPGLHASLGSLSAGFSRVEVRELKLQVDGAAVSLPSLDVDLPVLTAALNKKVSIARLVAKGWTLDLTHAKKLALARPLHALAVRPDPRPAREFSLLPQAYAAENAAGAAAVVFRGVFSQLRLPVDLALDGVELEGEVLLPPLAGQDAPRINVKLKGGGLAAGREGGFTVDLASAKADGSSLAVHSALTLGMDTPRTFSSLGGNTDATVSGPQFPTGVKLSISGSSSSRVENETYKLNLLSEGKLLAAVSAEYVKAGGRISGQWKIDLRNSDLAPFVLGRHLPIFVANGDGHFETDGRFAEVHVSGRLDASGEKLETLRPELAVLGSLGLSADFDVLHHGTSLRVERLDATMFGAKDVANVQALQPFEFNLATAELRVADPAKDLVIVSLDGLPLAWAKPFLGEVSVSGGDLRGEAALAARDGGLAVRLKTPLRVAGLSVAAQGKPLLRDLAATLDGSADYTPRGWQVQVTDLKIMQAATTLLTLDAKAGQLAAGDRAIKLAGHYQANLPGWFAQPVIGDSLQLAAGDASGEFAASLDKTNSLEIKIALPNLVATTNKPLPAANLDVRVDLKPDGEIAFNVPVALEMAGRKSDLQFTGTARPGNPATQIDAHLTSENLVVEDAMMLIPAGPADANAAATPATAAPASADSAPFWNAVNGQLTFALKKVAYQGAVEMSNVSGTVRLDATTLKLDAVRAAFGADSDLKLTGTMNFDPKTKAQPYALAADVALNNFDTAPAFRVLDPAKPPTVESRVTLNGHFTGRGGSIADVANRTHGDVQLTGKSGTFRGLSTDLTDKVQKTQSTAAAIGGLIGAVTGRKEYSDYVNKSQIFTDIAKYLSEIPFDQLSVSVTRDSDLNVVLKDFMVISPEVRLTGGGNVRHVENTPLLAQPLSLDLQLGARGKLADLLRRARLLEERQDNLGYFAFSAPIKIGGTLGQTDTSDLRNALLSSTLEKSGLLDRMLGK